MARCAWLSLFVVLAGWSQSEAADLTKIDRTIARLPQFKTTAPEYCLLVFGPAADTRVWLVWDGDVLYVDRNGNGDLTEPGERVEADRNTSHPDEDQFQFKCGSIPDGKLLHKDLFVWRMKMGHLRDTVPAVGDLLGREPDARGWFVVLDEEAPGRHGTGIEGRVRRWTQIYDNRGVLQFASRPEDAPVINYGGPWTITTTQEERWRVGQTEQFNLGVGTLGIGPGTLAYVEYDGVIPADLKPTVKVSYPPAAADQAVLEQSSVLEQRCCSYSLYGSVTVPSNIGTGEATVEVSLPDWPGTTVASSTHTITILPQKATVALEPISPRLKGRLAHTNSKGILCHIQFSPDGGRLIAGDCPGGVVHVWDVASGERVATFETGKGRRGAMEYFAVSPDWQTVYAPHAGKSQYERIERDGKILDRVTYDDEIRVWDLASGRLRQTLKHSPARRIGSLCLAPDGAHFLTIDELSGEYEAGSSRAVSLWDAATGTSADVPTGSLFSPDGRAVAGAISKSGDSTYCDTIQLFNVSPWQETASIPLPEELMIPSLRLFCPQGNVLVGYITRYEKRDDYQNYEGKLFLWDTVTGKELFSLAAPTKSEGVSYVAASPDGRFIARGHPDGHGRMYLVNVAERTSRTVDLGEDTFLFEPVFHPSGRWLAAPIQRIPKAVWRSEPPPEELAQPRIQIVDVESGKLLETLVSPQAYVTSVAFSPDGKTLATSGHGEVLLWDMSRPPGKDAADE